MESPSPSAMFSGGMIDQVHSSELIEGCVGALQALAKDVINRDIIRNIGAVPTSIELLYSESENIQRAATGLLCELAADKEGATQIEQEGATTPLTTLLNSKNEAVSAYAAAVLFKMSEGKSPDYKKHLNSELASSLYRDDTNEWLNQPAMDMGLMMPEEIYQTHIYGQTGPSLVDNSNIYQGIYESRQTIQAMSPVHEIYGTTMGSNVPMSNNDYSTYGQVTGLHQVNSPLNGHNQSQAWYDSDL